MQSKDVAKLALSTTLDTLQMYLGDLSDKDITVRPCPARTPLLWQLAHLVTAEKFLLEGELPRQTRMCPPRSPSSAMSEPAKSNQPAAICPRRRVSRMGQQDAR